MKLILAVFLTASFFYLEGCGEIPDTDDVHRDQQLQRSYAAPGQPIKPLEDPNDETHPKVPGE